MTKNQLGDLVREVLAGIAPEADLSTLDPGRDLREQLDIDSMDFLNFVTALSARVDIDVPEPDYPALFTVDGAVRYLERRAG